MQFLKHFFLANVLIGNEKATLSKYRANPFVESISINAMRVHIFAQGNNGSHWWGSKSRLTEHHQLRACRTVNHYVTPTLIMFQSERLERWRERESGRARERTNERKSNNPYHTHAMSIGRNITTMQLFSADSWRNSLIQTNIPQSQKWVYLMCTHQNKPPRYIVCVSELSAG